MKPMPTKIKNIVDSTLKSEFFKVVPEDNKEKVNELSYQIMHSIIMDSTSQFLVKLDKICDPIHNKILNMLANSNLPNHIQDQIKNMKQEKTFFNKLAFKISSLKEKLDDTVKFKLEDMKDEQSTTLLNRLDCKVYALTVCLNTIKKMNNTIVIEKLAQNDYSVNLVLVISEIEKKIKNTTDLAHVLSESLSYLKTNDLILENNQLTETVPFTSAFNSKPKEVISGKGIELENQPNVLAVSSTSNDLTMSNMTNVANTHNDSNLESSVNINNRVIQANKILQIREEQGIALSSSKKHKM
jgi:hypothetical protein